MIGASIELLEDLAAALSKTGGDIIDVDTSAQKAAGDAIEKMNSIAVATQEAISQAMTDMMKAVDASREKLDASDWTGDNRGTFNTHYETFTKSMTASQTNTNETFTGLVTAISKLGEDIDDYAKEIHTTLDAASEAAVAMGTAVTTQKTNLHNAMSGMNVS